MIYDVAIIGAGITGVMTAYKLACYDLSVAVMEAGEDVASGTTRANSAIVHAGYDAAEGTLKAKLNVDGCRQMPAIAEALHVKYDRCGSLVVAMNETEMEHVRMLYDRGIANGVPEMEVIDGEALRSLDPAIDPKAVGALWAKSAGIVCPYDLAVAVSENAAANGTDFYFNFKVSEVFDLNGIHRISEEDGERTVSARYIVNAAGLYAEEIAAIIGEMDFPVHVTPRRGEYLLLDKSVGSTVKHVLFAVPSENGKGILVSPTVDGNLILGPNAHAVEKEDTGTTADGLSEVEKGARYLVPEVNTRAVITSFAGVRATPADGDFYIKPSKQIPRVIHAAGIESPGLASSPAIGDYIVSLLAESGLSLKKRDSYIPARTAEGNHKLFREMTPDEKKEAIKKDPAYGKIVCRCETVTEGDILTVIRSPIAAKSLDMVKRRTRAGMGRCQGGFCSPRVLKLISEELGIPMTKVTKCGGNSILLTGKTK